MLIASYGVRQLTHQVVHVPQVLPRGLLIARTSNERESLLVTTLETDGEAEVIELDGISRSTAAARRSTISEAASKTLKVMAVNDDGPSRRM